ncbi:PQQ-binding-like beta-propeller repeat protein [Bacilliculturomica massiliensis]|uniref:PQQ-binding-like beta-propeller repeat protein n=1 Tax=Bacilliculturomica massiliensis TaxID=1917867 RepID=UPI0010312B49|nr:PQQ-binding-like beta-propeller repeat protein [Bacilliculturomica massiliensis]
MLKKHIKKALAAVLSLSMVLSMSGAAFAAADWPTYQGNEIHNGIVTDAVPTTALIDEVKLTLPNNGSGWDGVDSAPVMETRNGVTYAYVLYDGYTVSNDAGGGRLAKVNCNTGGLEWSKQISQTSGFQLSSPYLDTAARAIYVGTTGFNQKTGNDSLTVSGGVITDWTFSGGTAGAESGIVVSGDSTVTLNQSEVTLTSGKTHRSATGIRLNSAAAAPNVTITAILNGTVVGQKYLTSADVINNEASGNVPHYYLNQNFGEYSSTAENAVQGDGTTPADALTFTYEFSGNTAGAVIEYGRIYEQASSITKVKGIDGTPTNEWSYSLPNNNQINTPIVKSGDYLFFGTWSGNTGTYYQAHLNARTGKIDGLKDYNPGNGGFYWAGAVVDGGYVYFGGDKGYLYAQPVGSSFGSGTTAPINLSTVDGSISAGNVRSTIALVDGALYFTSQGGYLWCFNPNGGNPTFGWKAQLAGTSTSTPTVTATDLYVGYYSGFNAGGIQKVSRADGHTVSTVATPGPVQGSVLVYQTGGTDYLYVNTNSASGAGYCYDASGNLKWKTTSGTYALQGMATSNGYIVFGNDYDQFYVISAQ